MTKLEDSTPEHTKRRSGADVHPEVLAAYEYVQSVSWTADIMVRDVPAWYGWAIREAFLAGVSHAKGGGK